MYIYPVRYTQNLFLRGMCLVYLAAFASFYIQIPGLYGNNGILPARTQLMNVKSSDLSSKIHKKPTLLWFAPYIGLDVEYMLDALALTGIILSFTGLVLQKFCMVPVFAALWSLYFSLYQVGQTFMWFQWDTLLLEAGVISTLIAPWKYQRRRPITYANGPLTFWPARWLLFRLLFSAAVVKLSSNCPMWWNLTALSSHFQSMPLPTTLAWYAHCLPAWYLKVTAAFALAMELIVPWTFLLPLRSCRLAAAFLEIFLQIHIMMTGNFSYYNFLVIVLCLSLLDDGVFMKLREQRNNSNKVLTWLTRLPGHAAILAVGYATVFLYGVKLQPDYTIDVNITFTPAQFQSFLAQVIPYSLILGSTSLGLLGIQAILSNVKNFSGWKFFGSLIGTILCLCSAFFLFGLSTVPHSALHSKSNSTVLPQVRTIHTKLSHLHITNFYDIFRQMQGSDGRKEIIIEGSNHIEGPWQEYNFLYKPGNVNFTLPFVAPYSPRLDWQMYFAAYGTYHQNPWIMSLAYRLLEGRPEVLRLLGQNPFVTVPPKYVRADLYNYYYTPWSNRNSISWWTREKVGEYFPVFSRDHPPLIDYLRNLKIIGNTESTSTSVYLPFKLVLDQLRNIVGKFEGSVFVWSLFFTAAVIIFSRRK